MLKKAVYNRQDFLKLNGLPQRLRIWAEDMELEDYIRDEAFYHRDLPRKAPLALEPLKVAVIGSGPAGLGCADQLQRLGYDVTVFERDDRPGGLLMYGVPNIKLPKDLLMEKITELINRGVKFVLGWELQDEAGFAKLQEEFSAIVLCVGSRKPKLITNIPVDNKQIFQAKDFLTEVTKDMLNGTDLMNVKGKDVVIVGGGDTGVDCAAIALAQGANTVHQLEVQECQATANSVKDDLCNIVQGDFTISYGTLLKRLIRDEAGKLKAVETAQVEWRSERSGAIPDTVEVLGSEKILRAQVLILALGFNGPEDEIFTACGVKRSPAGMLADGGEYFTTTKEGVFAAGDARRGSGIVAWAFTEGRNAAMKCAEYLRR
ncbi:MAG: FAD-dependent oxidoreductase [Phascolarctobacterium sp.]|nr:FAD-dependent oxidoreductase [Phascolarctobacterium sp.]